MTTGIHHITAIAADGKENFHFYTKILGLRLVKKTVNQDDVETYHLFYGDRLGHPGMDLTFFIFRPPTPGKRGNGQVTTISLAVPEESLAFWQKRFEEFNVVHHPIEERFHTKRLVFFDNDNQRLALVGVAADELDKDADVWTKEIDEKYAIRSFYSATLSVADITLVKPVLEKVFGYTQIDQDDSQYLFSLAHTDRAQFLEVIVDPTLTSGLNSAGTVHHIAFRAKDQNHQLQMRNAVIKLGLHPTEVVERFYFQSVYFRIEAGILFEIATDEPGFTADEPAETLGAKLALPPFLEPHRTIIEQLVPALEIG